MSHDAIVVFTARSLEEILREGGSRDWRLDPLRARRAEYLVCTQNRHNTGFGAPTTAHGHAFLIARIADIVHSPKRPDRWMINIREFIPCDIPNIWGKNGHQRYPVRYTTLEALGIDLHSLPPFQPLFPQGVAGGLAEATGARLAPAEIWSTNGGGLVQARQAERDDADAWGRLDAILAQLDRIPDLPQPFEPLNWDEHGLPR